MVQRMSLSTFFIPGAYFEYNSFSFARVRILSEAFLCNRMHRNFLLHKKSFRPSKDESSRYHLYSQTISVLFIVSNVNSPAIPTHQTYLISDFKTAARKLPSETVSANRLSAGGQFSLFRHVSYSSSSAHFLIYHLLSTYTI